MATLAQLHANVLAACFLGEAEAFRLAGVETVGGLAERRMWSMLWVEGAKV